MQVVVSDATPLRYLAEIDQLELLPHLFKTIIIPSLVYEELQQPATPRLVRALLKSPPAWLKVIETEITSGDPLLMTLDKGERAALMLSLHLRADLMLIDDRKGVAAARKKGLESTGTLGVLVLASRRNLVVLAGAFAQLRQTGFYCSRSLMAEVLERESRNMRL